MLVQVQRNADSRRRRTSFEVKVGDQVEFLPSEFSHIADEV